MSTLIPNSSAERPPVSAAPAGACDAHIHIYDPAFHSLEPIVPNADVDAYQQVQALIGTRRAVVVQPRVYGTDNSATLAAIRSLGDAQTRGIAVVSSDVDEGTLSALDKGGIRGIRLSLHEPNVAAGDFRAVETLAHKVAPLGWHIQLHWRADQIAEQHALLQRLPVQLVIDHLGRFPLAEATSHPATRVLRTLLDAGRAWIKLSAPYLDSIVGGKGDYLDTDALAQTWLSIAPDRCVWGSDWPHVTEPLRKPDDAQLFDLLTRWCGDDTLRQRVLVQNPERLYGFHPT